MIHKKLYILILFLGFSLADITVRLHQLLQEKIHVITFENANTTAQEMATEVLKNSINIPSTRYINQGGINQCHGIARCEYLPGV